MDDTQHPDRPADDPEASAGGGATPDVNESVTQRPAGDPATRVAELERKLAQARAERDECRASRFSLLGRLSRYESLTQDEAVELMHGPPGQPIQEMIEELERKHLRGEG